MKLISFLFLLCLSIVPSQLLAFGIGLTPSTIEMSVKSGSHNRQILKVKNLNKEKAIKLTVGVADWILDDNGQVHLSPPSESVRSASSWINFSPSVLLLQPNTTQEVVVDINTPLALRSSGDFRTAIVMSTVLPSKKLREGKNGVWNRYQIASLIYANVHPGKSHAVITAAKILPKKETQSATLAMAIHNKGNSHSRLKGNIVLRKQSNGDVHNQPFETVLINNQKRSYRINIDQAELKPGNYDVLIKLSDNGRRIANLVKQPTTLTIH